MTATFYTFSKKENSTKRPAAGSGTAYGIYLKDATGILAPQIEIHYSGAGDPSAFNYAYIGDFERYYFVREWTYNKGIWTAQLEVDALATWKDYIGAASEYILRSSNTAYWNSSAVDNKYPTLAEMNSTYSDGGGANYPWNYDTFVISTIGPGSSGMGGPSYYALNQPEATSLFTWLNGTGIDSYIEDLDNAFNNFADDLFLATYNPIQYIISARWLPYAVAGTAVTSINIGKKPINISAKQLFPSPMQKLGPYSVSIPKHPQMGARGKYLTNAPYSYYVFELQPYGRIEIDGGLLVDCTTLSFTIYADPISGDSLLYLTGQGANQLAVEVGTYAAKVGSPVQISQESSNIMQNMIVQTGRAAVNAASDNWFGVVDAAISGVMDTRFQGTSKGSEGSFLYGTDRGARLHLYYHNLPDNDIAHYGVPVCRVAQIGNVGGFIIAGSGDIDLPSTQQERETIAGYLTGGFFYE